MLHGVLNMPPVLWCDSPIDIAQRHSRYKEASQRIEQLERELAEAKETIEMLEIRHGATMLCHQAQMDEVTKQRDALAEALREIASGAYSWKTCVDVIAPKALAATKGGKP
jgi:predicted  nucleic acid-binding Zn-ribbon protein